MQPYREGTPIADAELCPDNAEELQQRLSELMENGADEVRVFKPSKEQLIQLLKNKGMNRKQRRDYIKNHGMTIPEER